MCVCDSSQTSSVVGCSSVVFPSFIFFPPALHSPLSQRVLALKVFANWRPRHRDGFGSQSVVSVSWHPRLPPLKRGPDWDIDAGMVIIERVALELLLHVYPPAREHNRCLLWEYFLTRVAYCQQRPLSKVTYRLHGKHQFSLRASASFWHFCTLQTGRFVGLRFPQRFSAVDIRH